VERNRRRERIGSRAPFRPLESLEERTLLSSVFFMHQSVGQGILDDHGAHPGLRRQLETAAYQVNDFSLYDWGGGGSQPTDIAGLFADANHDGHYGDALDSTPALAAGKTADILMFKSCFSAIDYLADDTGAATLDAWEQAFIDTVAPYANQHPAQKIVAMPAAPTRPGRPGIDAAANTRARQWSQWLAGTFLTQYATAGNVFSFNLFDLLADPAADATNPNMLREEYRGPTGDPHDPDCHPNDTGYSAAADALFSFIQTTVQLSNSLFVSPTGDDANDGSAAHPYRHAQHALDVVQPGQRVFLRAGTYNEYLLFGSSGQSGRPITLAGYPGEQAVLSGTGLNYRYGIGLGTHHDITIQDLTLSDYIADGTRGYGIGGEGGNDNLTLRRLDISLVGEVVKLQASSAAVSHNVLIENVTGHGYDAGGFNIGPAGSVDGVTIRHVTLTGPGTGNDTAIDGIAVEHGQNITIENTVVTGHAGDGIDLKADHVTVRRVTVTGQARNGIKLWGASTVLENSIAMSNGLTSLVLAGGGPYTLTNNLVGNTIGHDYSAVFGDGGAASQVIANANLWVSTAGQTGTLIWASAGTTFQGDYNLYDAPNRPDGIVEWDSHATYTSDDITSGAWAAASGMDAHALYADPQLAGDFRPMAGSPAIDRCPTGPAVYRLGAARPLGNGYDVGPFETAGSGPDVLAPTATLGAASIALGAATGDITVTYSDNIAVDAASLDDDDLTVTGPLGGSLPVRFVGVDAGGNGTPRVATYRITAPGVAWNSPDNGAYSISVAAGEVADTIGNTMPETALGSFNVAFTSDVLGRFGTVAGRKNVAFSLRDADGTLVKFSLSGPGAGEVVSTDGGWDVNLTGTSASSGVTVATTKSRTPGDDGKAAVRNVHADGSLQSLVGTAASLTGSLTVEGTLGRATLDALTGATIQIGGTPTATTGTSLTFGVVKDSGLTSGMPIGTLRVKQWLNTDGAPDLIQAPRIATLSATGDTVKKLPGDFAANLVLSGLGETRASKTLGTATVKGALKPSVWDLHGGSAGRLTLGGAVGTAPEPWELRNAATIGSLTMGDAANAVATVAGDVGAVKAVRWRAGSVEARTVASLTLTGAAATKTAPAVAGDFGADLTLSGDPAPRAPRKTLGSAAIGGSVSGLWQLTGPAGALRLGHVLVPLALPDVASLSTSSPLVREVQAGVPTGLIAVEGADRVSRITAVRLGKWPKTLFDYAGAGGPPSGPGVLAAMALESLKKHFVTSGLGAWKGPGALLAPGLMASFGPTSDPAYRYVKGVAYIYDNALAIEALLSGGPPDAESQARAFQVADALTLLVDRDGTSGGYDATFTDLRHAALCDAYMAGVVAASRDAARVTVRRASGNRTAGNQSYVAMALLRAAAAAGHAGDAARAADYRRAAKELLLGASAWQAVAGTLGGFAMGDPATRPVRSCENNIDLATAFEMAAATETDPVLRAKWLSWRDSAQQFASAMYGGNVRFPTLSWISGGWQYFRAGADANQAVYFGGPDAPQENINVDLVPLDTGAWNSLQRGDDRDVAFDFLEFLASSTDAKGRTYVGFDPGFRAVLDESLTSRRDGVGAEVTAYMALVARHLGDAAVLAALPDRAALAAPEQAAFDALTAAAAGPTDHDLADYLLGQLSQIQLHASNGDGLGLVAAPVPNVGTGEYNLVNGWALASTCWARFAYQGWNIFTD
jgi:hypothetical protein